MKILIGIAILLLSSLFIGMTEISISPFNIKMHAPDRAIGFVLIVIGVALYSGAERRLSYTKGAHDMLDKVKYFIPKAGKDEKNDDSDTINVIDSLNKQTNIK